MAIYTDASVLIPSDKHTIESKPVWGFAFKERFDDNLNAKPELNQPPVKGVIQKCYSSKYFVPFKKNSTELCESRKVNAYNRNYASTYEEAWAGYAAAIQQALSLHDKRKDFLKSYLINLPDFWDSIIITDNTNNRRFSCNISPIEHAYAQPIPNYSHSDILMYPDTVLPNAIPSESVCWLSQKDGYTDEINQPVEKPAHPQFLICGYDKDNDIYDDLYFAESEDEAEFVKKQWTARQSANETIFRSSCGDPYDWFEIQLIKSSRGV